jgi:hypothetical protein
MVAQKSKRVAVDLPLWFMSSCYIPAVHASIDAVAIAVVALPGSWYA